jgi:hypothetical protein
MDYSEFLFFLELKNTVIPFFLNYNSCIKAYFACMMEFGNHVQKLTTECPIYC